MRYKSQVRRPLDFNTIPNTEFGYFDPKRDRQALYTSFNNTPDSLGLSLCTNSDHILVSKGAVPVLRYDYSVIETSLLAKHSKTLFVEVLTRKDASFYQECTFGKALFCAEPSFDRFRSLLNEGQIFLDFMIAIKGGVARDHGFLWRMRSESLPKLFARVVYA